MSDDLPERPSDSDVYLYIISTSTPIDLLRSVCTGKYDYGWNKILAFLDHRQTPYYFAWSACPKETGWDAFPHEYDPNGNLKAISDVFLVVTRAEAALLALNFSNITETFERQLMWVYTITHPIREPINVQIMLGRIF